MADSSDLQVDMEGPARRNGEDRPGSKKSIVANSGDAASPTGGSAQAPRRTAAYGGRDGSYMQEMIGGPFMGRSGNAASKAARYKNLPA